MKARVNPKTMFALWWCLKPQTWKALRDYQYDNHDSNLQPPATTFERESAQFSLDLDMTTEQIGRFMRQAPSRSRGTKVE